MNKAAVILFNNISRRLKEETIKEEIKEILEKNSRSIIRRAQYEGVTKVW